MPSIDGYHLCCSLSLNHLIYSNGPPLGDLALTIYCALYYRFYYDLALLSTVNTLDLRLRYPYTGLTLSQSGAIPDLMDGLSHAQVARHPPSQLLAQALFPVRTGAFLLN